MERLKNHLPSLGVLAVAVAVAAVAYSVYSEDGSSGSDRTSKTGIAGLVAAPKDSKTTHKATHRSPFPETKKRAGHAANNRVPAAGSLHHGEAVRGATLGADPGLAAGPVLQPEQFHPGSPVSPPRSPASPRKSPRKRNSSDGIKREFRRLIDGPKGRGPTPTPRQPSPRRPVAPTPTQPRPNAPVGGTPAAPAPTSDPGPGTTPTTTPADPDAGLDDTPVGGLDPNDLGEPVDQTDTGAAPEPGTGTPTDTGADGPIDIVP
jgi:hypothetical protein